MQAVPACISSSTRTRTNPLGKRSYRCRAGGGGIWNPLAGILGEKTNKTGKAEYLELMEVEAEEGRRRILIYECGVDVDLSQLEQLFEKVGWPKRPEKKVESALKNSYLVACIHMYERDMDGTLMKRELVGLARATSDQAFNATIWDVIVDPYYQGQGLGKALLEQVVRTLLRRDIGDITLFADAKVVEFYKQLGFEADPEGIKGMFWYPRY